MRLDDGTRSEGAPVFDLSGVTKRFRLRGGLFEPRRELTAVDGVSLQVREGDVLGIVGESGSGKTTLSKLMLGLLEPSAGEILLDGAPVAKQRRLEIARRVQFVFQDPFSSLNPQRAVGAIVEQPLRIHGIGTRRSQAARARELLDLVGLPARVFDAFPGQLSGGQRQRVVIARALALEPRVLICDEPTSALDVSVQAQILNLLLELRSELSLTFVMVSHNLSVIRHMATRVAVMYLGRIVEFDTAEAVFAGARHPYTRVLLGSALTVEPGAGIPELRLTGPVPSPTAVPPGCRFHTRCPMAAPICATVPPPSNADGQFFAECHFAPPRAGRPTPADGALTSQP